MPDPFLFLNPYGNNIPLGPTLEVNEYGGIDVAGSSGVVVAVAALEFFTGVPIATGATTGVDNGIAQPGQQLSPFAQLNAYLNVINNAAVDVDFGGQFFGSSIPWAPPPNCSPVNGGILALPGAWQANNLTGASWASSKVTFTTTSPHGVTVGQQFYINGCIPTKYDGFYTAIAGTTGSTLVASLASNPGAINTLSLPQAALVNAPLNIANGNVRPRNFTVNCNSQAYWGALITSTTGIDPSGISVTGWNDNFPGDINCGGILVSAGKVNGAGPYNLNQVGSATNPQNWAGCGIRLTNCADSKLENIVANWCTYPIRVDPTTFACTFIGAHPFNGGAGTTIQNQVNIQYLGYDCVFIGFEDDSGAILCEVNALSHNQSPPGPRLSIIGSKKLNNTSNATYPSSVRVRSTQANTSLVGLVITGDVYPSGSTLPCISCEPYGAQVGTGVSPAVSNATSITLTSYTGTPAIGNVMEGFGVPGQTYLTGVAGNTITFNNPVTLTAGTALIFTATTGTFASTVPPAWIASATNSPVGAPTSNFRMNGVVENLGSSINQQGYFSIYGSLTNIRAASQGGTLTLPTDANGSISANQVNTPVVLNATASPGTQIQVTSNTTTALTTQAITISGNSANVGNGTVGSVSFGGSAPYGGYVLTATSSTVFSVTDPNGTALGNATVGSAFTSSEINLTITAGGTAFAAGDTFTIINNAGTATINNVTNGLITLYNANGNGIAICICVANSNGTNASWKVSGDVNPNAEIGITVPASGTALPTQKVRGTYFFSGGTVSGITITRSGTARPTGVTAGPIPYSPGDSVIPTYSAVPTVWFFSQ